MHLDLKEILCGGSPVKQPKKVMNIWKKNASTGWSMKNKFSLHFAVGSNIICINPEDTQ